MNLKEAQQIDAECYFTLYARTPLLIARGEGMFVWDDAGRRYLDFCSGGRAVNALGHCHPKVVAAIREQAGTLLHTSNDFYTEPQERLARLLTSRCACKKIFFCNSGGEANEAAIKLARKFGKLDSPGRTKIISTWKSFHGRTMGALSATGQPKYQGGFAPLVGDFAYVDYNDLAAMDTAIDDKTCAVILEPVQGESGTYPATKEFMRGVRKLCDERGAALIIDEVQSGLGRTGKLFAYEHFGIEPDIITLSKALGGGMPIGAMLANERVAAAFQPGDHGTTFGGTAIAAAAGLAALSAIIEEGLPENAAQIGAYIAKKIDALRAAQPLITGYRQFGCMIAIDLAEPIAARVKEIAQEKGLLFITVGDTMLRLLPALICTRENADEAITTIAEAIALAAPAVV